MLEVYKPHTNRKAVGVWLCSAAKRASYYLKLYCCLSVCLCDNYSSGLY